MKTFRDDTIMLRMVYDALKVLNLDTQLIFERSQIDPNWLKEPSIRTPHTGQLTFWQVVSEVSGDPHIGLHIGENMPVYRGHILEYLFYSHSTFGDALNSAMNYHRLLSDATQTTLIIGEEESQLIVGSRLASMNKHPQYIECAMVGIINFFKAITDNHFQPTADLHAFEPTRETIFNLPAPQKSVGAPPSSLRLATKVASSSRMPSSMAGGSNSAMICLNR